MKIVHFTDSWRPTRDGVVTSIEAFSDELRKLGHEVHVVCPKGGVAETRYVHPISAVPLVTYPGYRLARLAPGKVKELLKKIKPDIIHVHTPMTVGISALWASWLLRKKVIGSYHTYLPEYLRYLLGIDAKFILGSLTDLYTRLFYNRCKKIIVPSSATRKYLRRVGVKKPIEILPTGIKVVKTSAEKKKNNVPVILHVGRISKEKSIDVIIRAFQRVLQKKKARLIITSDGPERESLEALVKHLKLEKHVTFAGVVSEKEKYRLYKTSDVFVVASMTETQGIVALEAMSQGCPVIARDAMGLKDYVNRDNGIMFKTEFELVRAILKAIEDQNLRRKVIANGHKTVAKYSIENSTKQLIKLYEGMLEKA